MSSSCPDCGQWGGFLDRVLSQEPLIVIKQYYAAQTSKFYIVKGSPPLTLHYVAQDLTRQGVNFDRNRVYFEQQTEVQFVMGS
jgi:hypothetical protein